MSAVNAPLPLQPPGQPWSSGFGAATAATTASTVTSRRSYASDRRFLAVSVACHSASDRSLVSGGVVRARC